MDAAFAEWRDGAQNESLPSCAKFFPTVRVFTYTVGNCEASGAAEASRKQWFMPIFQRLMQGGGMAWRLLQPPA